MNPTIKKQLEEKLEREGHAGYRWQPFLEGAEAGFRLALKMAAEKIRNWDHLGGASEATLVTCRNIERVILSLGSEEK